MPDIVGECLTTTAAGAWVLWAHKVARAAGDSYLPMSGGDPYPDDAVASCRLGGRHAAPDPGCTCGFHALSQPLGTFTDLRAVHLEVALSGRVLAFEWPHGGVLLRAARQRVMRIDSAKPALARTITANPGHGPDDPDGSLAVILGSNPKGAGPVRIRLPRSAPRCVAVTECEAYHRAVLTAV